MSSRVGVALVLALAALAVPLRGESDDIGGLTLPRCSALAPYFCADAAYFLADSSYVVEVYFRICNDGLQFVKTDDGFVATADLSVVLTDGKSNQIAGDTYRIKLHTRTYAGTTSIDSCRTQVVSFKARKGDFRMKLGLYDRDSRVKSLAEAELSVPSLEDTPSLSDIEFLEPAPGPYGGLRQGFGPRVNRVYGTALDSIPFYYEVYGGGNADSLAVVEQVLSTSGTKLLEFSKTSVGAGSVPHLDVLPGDTLSSGRYTLRLNLRSRDGKPLATRTKDFEVRSQNFYSNRDLDEAVAILTYVAPGSLIDAFTKADEQGRKKIWEDFWRDKDPTPGTPRNEYLEEHLRRFRYANEHFGIPLTPGWKSDRGRIYVLYGEPDEIESHPFELDRKPTEVWTYYSKGKRFVFVDETGFGDYVLEGS